MASMANTATMELNYRELGNVTGGDSSEAFMVYAEYIDTLYEKYGCQHMGIRYLKTVCTPDEKARISELWHAFLAA